MSMGTGGSSAYNLPKPAAATRKPSTASSSMSLKKAGASDDDFFGALLGAPQKSTKSAAKDPFNF